LDFTVEHRAGRTIAHADALIRHVGNVMNQNSLNRESVLQEQRKDAFCKKQTPRTHSRKSEFFLDTRGILYRRQFNGKHQLVVPQTLVQGVIKENHNPLRGPRRHQKNV
jgi:hypothetical protein